jgi:hypothetical protein
MEGNCKKAIAGMNRVQSLFPEVDFYIPAVGDLSLQIMFLKGQISEENILDADLEILDNCHNWVFYRFDESSGSEVEREGARKRFGDDVAECNEIHFDLSKSSTSRIRKVFTPIVDAAIAEFRKEK